MGAADGRGTRPVLSFAGALGLDWEVPGRLPDLLSGESRWGSGVINETLGSFRPVSGIVQGNVFSPKLPGLFLGKLAYSARLNRPLSFTAGGAVFLRTDWETLIDGELDPRSDSRFLGGELFGSLVWAPQSAIRVTAGAGVFFPGGAFVPDAKIRWKLSTGLMVSL
jgi:hypothetical protein